MQSAESLKPVLLPRKFNLFSGFIASVSLLCLLGSLLVLSDSESNSTVQISRATASRLWRILADASVDGGLVEDVSGDTDLEPWRASEEDSRFRKNGVEGTREEFLIAQEARTIQHEQTGISEGRAHTVERAPTIDEVYTDDIPAQSEGSSIDTRSGRRRKKNGRIGLTSVSVGGPDRKKAKVSVFDVPQQYLLVTDVSEQLGKARFHMAELIYLAHLSNRTLVLPRAGSSQLGIGVVAGGSRFGITGTNSLGYQAFVKQKSMNYLPFSTYWNVTTLRHYVRAMEYTDFQKRMERITAQRRKTAPTESTGLTTAYIWVVDGWVGNEWCGVLRESPEDLSKVSTVGTLYAAASKTNATAIPTIDQLSTNVSHNDELWPTAQSPILSRVLLAPGKGTDICLGTAAAAGDDPDRDGKTKFLLQRTTENAKDLMSNLNKVDVVLIRKVGYNGLIDYDHRRAALEHLQHPLWFTYQVRRFRQKMLQQSGRQTIRYLAIQWRMETASDDVLKCAEQLVKTVERMRQKQSIDFIYFATDYPDKHLPSALRGLKSVSWAKKEAQVVNTFHRRGQAFDLVIKKLKALMWHDAIYKYDIKDTGVLAIFEKMVCVDADWFMVGPSGCSRRGTYTREITTRRREAVEHGKTLMNIFEEWK